MNALQKAALLTLLPTMNKIDCMQCSWKFRDAFDVSIDHHEFAYYLDELRTKGLLETYYPLGRSPEFTIYRLVEAQQ